MGSTNEKRHLSNENEAKERTKKMKKEKKRKKQSSHSGKNDRPVKKQSRLLLNKQLNFDYKYILAPMVGASELAFRLLCRKYGAQLAYTPMMSSSKFASSQEYRESEFQTIPQDRPLVCHFCANNPHEFATAAKLVEHQCDAIDLNLGCPQRTAYVGHFGSYLLDNKDRELILDIIRAGVKAVRIPIFCKIRLLNTIQETVELCQQLRDAGASLIAIHARYRASFERKGPGARDGPAMLEQVTEIKSQVEGIPIISNGNVITYEDVENNLKSTQADGIMSAEGILDNPALFLPRYGPRDELAKEKRVAIADPLPEYSQEKEKKKRNKLLKKLKEIEKIQATIKSGGSINQKQREKLAKKEKTQKKLEKLNRKTIIGNNGTNDVGASNTKMTTLEELYESASDPLDLAGEYLSLVRRYPIKIRTVIFHTRRMLKDVLNQYQLMEECVACQSVQDVEAVVQKCAKYRKNPEAFVFDREKAARQKQALEKKRLEEGKRKAYEARMIRKAKREGLADLEHYLRMGAEVPTVETIERLQSLPRDQQLTLWKKDHSQHCMSYHLGPEGCTRDRACAFLHVDAKGTTSFVESEEVAG